MTGRLRCNAGSIDSQFSDVYADAMDVQLTPGQEAFIRQAIEKGRLLDAEEAVQQALILWENRERCRAEILSALDEAEADLEAGNFSEYSEHSLLQLGEELKREARSTATSAIER